MSLETNKNLELLAIPYMCAAASHIGLKRANNEDKFLIDPLNNLFLVVDGMGGHAAGEIAAKIAVETISHSLTDKNFDSEKQLKHAIILANNKILEESQLNDDFTGMGCVISALIFKEKEALIANVGDSRIYRIRNRKIEQLSTDHSVIGQLEKTGEFSEFRLMQHPQRNEITKCLGIRKKEINDDDFVELVNSEFNPEDAFLLCSDGLTDMVASFKILEIILENTYFPQKVVKNLINEANQMGGKDNITVIFVAGSKFAQESNLQKLQSSKKHFLSFLSSKWLFGVCGFLFAISLIVLLFYFGLIEFINTTTQ